jgi:outer membrane autotransporter protein
VIVDNDNERNKGPGRSRYNAGETQLFGELGYGLSFGQIAAEPFVGLAWVHLRTDSFNENGGISALQGFGNRSDTGYSALGMFVGTLNKGTIVSMSSVITVQHQRWAKIVDLKGKTGWVLRNYLFCE